MTILAGRAGSVVRLSAVLVRVDKFSKEFVRAILQIDGILVYGVSRGDDKFSSVAPGTTITVSGEVVIFSDQEEILVSSVQAEGTRLSSRSSFKAIRRRESLHARSKAIQSIVENLNDKRFIQTQSPSVVSEWVKGDTTPFAMSYYGKVAYLSISNMIYHQMLMVEGFNNIYEIGPLHRAETPSTRKKLSEFTIVDISMSNAGIESVMDQFESVICAVYDSLQNQNYYSLELVPPLSFERVDFSQLVEDSGLEGFLGSQLPAQCREFLNKTYKSFVWVTGFDVLKRPMYTKHEEGKSVDCQLWYRGELYLVAGSVIEKNVPKLREQIRLKGSDPIRYSSYLKQVSLGLPEVSMAGMGLERFLSLIVKDSVASDFVHMPRYQSKELF